MVFLFLLCSLGYTLRGKWAALPWWYSSSSVERPIWHRTEASWQQATPAHQLYECAILETDLSVPVKPSMGKALANILATASWETSGRNSPAKPLCQSDNQRSRTSRQYMDLLQGIGLWNGRGWLSKSEVHKAGNHTGKVTTRNPMDTDQSCCAQAVRRTLQASKGDSTGTGRSHWPQTGVSLSLSSPSSFSLLLPDHLLLSLWPEPSFKSPSNCLSHTHQG